LNIGTNVITVNTLTPGTRFGGLEVIDSGSSPLRSGSLYFDSINDQWIFVHQNTAGGVTSSVVLMGPPTFNNVGNETLLTQNRVLKGGGLEHITDSQISDNGITVSITNGLSVGTSITASSATINGNITATGNTHLLGASSATTTINRPDNTGRLDIGGGASTSANSGARVIFQGVDAAAGSRGTLTLSAGILASPSTGEGTIYLSTSGSNRIAITPDGNVGIGTISPAQRLQVIGNAIIGANSNSSVAARLDITAGGSGFDSVIDFGFFDTFDAGIWNIGRKGSTGTFFISNFSTGTEVNVVTINSSNNNFGIGTTNPQARLDVSGSAIISGTVTASILTPNQAVFTNASDGLVSNPITGTGNVVMSASPTLTGTITAASISASANISASTGLFSGNIGIGTTSPVAKLNVHIGDIAITATPGVGTRDNRYLSIYRGSLGADSAGVIFGTGPSTNNWFIGHPYSSGGVFNAFVISERELIRDGNATLIKTPAMYFTPGTGTAAGNIGIANTNPQSILHVAGTTAYGTIRISPTSANGESAIAFFDDVAGSDTNDAWVVGHAGWGNTGDFVIGNENNGSGGNVRLLIEKAGNIGIGTASPDANLTVQGQASFNSGSLANPGIAARGDLNTGIYFPAADTIGFVEGGVEAMRLDASGRLGIGTTIPSRTLTVNGSTNITGSLDVTGAFTAQTKSFKIQHQVQTDKSLVYGVLEGPEHAVYVRGKLTNANIIQLPDEWEWLVDEDTITVQLTPIGSHQKLYVESTNSKYITIAIDGFFTKNINCYYLAHATRKDVAPLQTVQ
jgi:hypothetical protein